MRMISMTFKYATIVFALAGLVYGSLSHLPYTTSLVCLLACIGAAVSVIAAAACMLVNRVNRVNVLSLILNLILFIVLAKEMEIIG